MNTMTNSTAFSYIAPSRHLLLCLLKFSLSAEGSTGLHHSWVATYRLTRIVRLR